MKTNIVITIILLIGTVLISNPIYGKSGKIIFTDVYAHPDSLDKNDLKQNYNLLEDIYFWVKLDKPLAETYDELNMTYDYSDEEYTYNYALRFYINNEIKSRWIFEMPVDEFNHNRLIDFTLYSSDRNLKARFGYTVNYWIDMISDLQGGVHKLKVDFIPLNINNIDGNPPVLATGSFELVVDPADRKEFKASKSAILPEPTIINQDLESQILNASVRVYPNLEPVRAIITDVTRDWSYSSDDDGNIRRRYLVTSVVYKNLLDGSCVLRSGIYYQKHKGYGIFGDMFYLKPATGYFDYAIPCDIVSK